jgi:DNA-binding protein Fis
VGQDKPTIRELLEQAIDQVVGKGIYWPEVQAEFEKLFILKVLERTQGSIQKAASLMGIHRNTLSKKIRQFEIDRSVSRGSRS